MIKKGSLPSLVLLRSTILLSLTACMALPQSASAAPILPAQDRASSNPGAQLNRAREYMERQRVLRQIQEDQAGRKEKVQGAEDKPFGADAQGVSFELKKVTFVPAASNVLPQEDSAYGDKTLVGTGFGFRYALKDWLNVDIGMGVPLKRTINDDQQDQARLHFMLSATY